MPVSEAQKRANRKWDANHPEVIKAYRKKYNETHRDKVNEYARNYMRRSRTLKAGFLELASIKCF